MSDGLSKPTLMGFHQRGALSGHSGSGAGRLHHVALCTWLQRRHAGGFIRLV